MPYGSSVDDHSSRIGVAANLMRPYPRTRRAHPIRLFGLAPDGVYLAPDVTTGTGALLPHRFTCTTLARCSLLSVALSIASPLLDVIQHPALWSPDFPHI